MNYDEIIGAIKSVLPEREFYALHEPYFGEQEKALVSKCIESGWVSYAGEYVNQFETELAKTCGVKNAICVSSGTVALFLALKALGLGEGDGVIIPSLTFVATPNAVSHTGATPHFVDVSRETLGINPQKLRDYLSNVPSGTIKAIMPVHIFGNPCEIEEIRAIADEFGVAVVEDAAESLGSTLISKALGGFGELAAISFNGNKIATTGGGGAVLTNDDNLAEQIRHISTTAKQSHAYEFIHDQIGYNFRMPNVNAAIGVAQLEKLQSFVDLKTKLAANYKAALQDVDGVEFFEHSGGSNNWLNAIILEDGGQRNDLIEKLQAEKIGVRAIWKPMHMLDIYRKHPRVDLSVTEDLYERIICLPSSAFLAEDA